MLEQNNSISSIAEIKEDVEANGGVKVSYSAVKKLFKKKTGLKFKKVKKVPQHANSLRNQYMR